MRDSKGPLPATSNLDLYSNGTAIGTNFGRQELVPGAFCVWFGAEGGREGGDGGRNKLGVAPQMHGTHMKGGVGVPDGSPLSLSLSTLRPSPLLIGGCLPARLPARAARACPLSSCLQGTTLLRYHYDKLDTRVVTSRDW